MRLRLPQLQQEIEVKELPANLLAVLCAAKVPIARSCGGQGVCGTCHVRIAGEGIPPESALEKRLQKRRDGQSRFACLIEIPESAASKIWEIETDYW